MPPSPPTPSGSARPPTFPGASAVLFLLACLAVHPVPLSSQVTPATPCATPDHRAFDFWIGSWDVHRPDGARAGRNEIRPVMGGCVLHESYDGAQGFHGESFNSWDRGRGVWHQTWVDNGGTVLLLDGGVRDGAMVLEGTTHRPDGTRVLNRITWTVLDESGDRVRQHWESSADGGATWSTVFDGEYRRRSPAEG